MINWYLTHWGVAILLVASLGGMVGRKTKLGLKFRNSLEKNKGLTDIYLCFVKWSQQHKIIDVLFNPCVIEK